MSAPSHPTAAAGHSAPLPPVTIVIEWENAIDVEDEWTGRAMAALEHEMAAVAGRSAVPPRILFLYDAGEVVPGTVEQAIDRMAPRLKDHASVEVEATAGLQYYELKNAGIAQARTDFAVLLDSDAAPQPGWLEALLAPFADPATMVVGGFTILAYDDLLSRTMALSWFFDLASEREQTLKRRTIHANNCAMRTDFFRAHPFPDLPMFKKQCEYWRKDLTAAGHKLVRTADAVTIHAPHPGYGFVAWRGWSSGRDGDALAFYTGTTGRAARLGLALRHLVKKVVRAWRNILTKGASVDLPVWQRPAALLIALGYYLCNFVGQASSALARDFAPMPVQRPLPPLESSAASPAPDQLGIAAR